MVQPTMPSLHVKVSCSSRTSESWQNACGAQVAQRNTRLLRGRTNPRLARGVTAAATLVARNGVYVFTAVFTAMWSADSPCRDGVTDHILEDSGCFRKYVAAMLGVFINSRCTKSLVHIVGPKLATYS